MTKKDFCFTVGYAGSSAIVDKKARSRFGKYNVDQLLEEGLLKPAFCSALYDNNEKELKKVLNHYNEKTGLNCTEINDLKKIFGVFKVPEGIKGLKKV